MSKHNNLALLSTFKSISLITSVSVCCIGLLVLYGWFFDIVFFKSIVSNFPPMKQNSAIAFVLIGISLLLQRLSFLNKRTYIILSKVLGIVVTLFGIATFLREILGINLPIDPLFFANSAGDPAPVALINFILIGLALIFYNKKRMVYFNQSLAAIIGLSGLLILTGYFFNFHSGTDIHTVTHSSLYIAIGFILISVSLFFMQPAQGIMSLFISNTYGGTVARRFIPLVIIVPVLLGYLRILGESLFQLNFHTGMEFYSICITIILIIMTIFISSMLMKADLNRMKVEDKLRQSNTELNDLYNQAPCGYHSLDEHGIIVRINQTELDWLGYSEEEVIGKMKATEMLTPASRHFFYKYFPDFKQQGFLHDVELEMLRKDGSTFTAILNATAVKDKNGNFLMSRSTIFDVSERKRIEKELRVSEQRFHSAMDTAPIGMAIISLDGKHIEVNQALCQLLGYSKEELINMNFQQITHPADLNLDVENSQKLIEGKIPLNQIEKRYIRKNGEIIWVQLTASILRDTSNNKPLYFITQVEDITDRKLTEERIRHLAYHDTLTNLPNRRLLLDRLNHAIDFAKRHQNMLALMFLDLDKFKSVNDTLGHDVGDELLKAVAVRLNLALRSIDTIARISGDEFVIILNELTTASEAAIIASKIIESMNNRFLIHGHELHIGCSIGISIYPNDGDEISELMKKADLAMYVAKESGRNQYHYYQL